MFRKKLALSAAARCLRKQPLGMRREDPGQQGELPSPSGEALCQLVSPQEGAGDGNRLLAAEALDQPQELRAESESPEEPVMEPSQAVPMFEGEWSGFLQGWLKQRMRGVRPVGLLP